MSNQFCNFIIEMFFINFCNWNCSTVHPWETFDWICFDQVFKHCNININCTVGRVVKGAFSNCDYGKLRNRYCEKLRKIVIFLFWTLKINQKPEFTKFSKFANPDTKIVFFTDFHNFHNFILWLWCLLKNQLVLCCEILIFHNHNFATSQIQNFTNI